MLSCPKFLVAAANPNMEECASAAVQAVMYSEMIAGVAPIPFNWPQGPRLKADIGDEDYNGKAWRFL